MFDYENLWIYQKAKSFNGKIYLYLKDNSTVEHCYKDQLRRASFSIMLNIAEGNSRFSKADKRRFFIISRGSIFECAAIIDFFLSENLISVNNAQDLKVELNELSKKMYYMIQDLSK